MNCPLSQEERTRRETLFRSAIEQNVSSTRHSITFDADGRMHVFYSWASLSTFYTDLLKKAGLTGRVCFWCGPESEFNYPPRVITYDLDTWQVVTRLGDPT